jgi:hypothetical protein
LESHLFEKKNSCFCLNNIELVSNIVGIDWGDPDNQLESGLKFT